MADLIPWSSHVTDLPIIIPVFKTTKLQAMLNILKNMTANKKDHIYKLYILSLKKIVF
jgi:hypothetical protein